MTHPVHPVDDDPAPAAVFLLDRRGDLRALSDIERDTIRFAIQHYGGRMSEVARRLGIGRSTLYRKMKEYAIDPVEMRDDRAASRTPQAIQG